MVVDQLINRLISCTKSKTLHLRLTVEFDGVSVDDALFGVRVLDRGIVVRHEVTLQRHQNSVQIE